MKTQGYTQRQPRRGGAIWAWARKLKRIVERLSFRTYTVNLSIEGEPFTFFVGDRVGQEWYCKEDWSNFAQIRWLLDHMMPGSNVVLICGAHHGILVLPIARCLGESGRVYCIEAHPKNVEILRRNVSLNHLDNVTVLQRVVASQGGEAKITDWYNARIGSAVDKQIGVPMIKCRASTLDEIVEEIDCIPDLVIIDIEGAEVDVFKGAKTLLKH